MSIIDLQETSPNNWKAKYRGNYGTYTIKITTDGTNTTKFSCSCPSSYYPCKHIPMVQEEIKRRIATAQKALLKDDNLSIESMLENVSPGELRNFIIRQAAYNPELTNSILLEFSHKKNKEGANNYSVIIQEALNNTHFDYEDMYDYYEGFIEIDILDQWLEKAQQYVSKENFKEAILICKACIEEYADWLQDVESEIEDYIEEKYLYDPFEILADIISKSDEFSKELYDYCKIEVSKAKYKDTVMDGEFYELMGELALTVNPENFIELQDKLLNAISDRGSAESERIIQRKIDLYRNLEQPEKAWEIVEENIQIESFRKELIKKKIAENKLDEAKKLIAGFIPTNNNYYRHDWDQLSLAIAQKENDIPAIRKISFSFIASHFIAEYYQIYKSTYTDKEWVAEIEKLIRNYQKDNRYFSSSLADVLISENQAERLMNYVEKHLSVDILNKYYIHFPSPEKTLGLFRQAIDEYVKNNTGRAYYEHVATLFGKMRKIKGGQALVHEMTSQYKLLYKNRRAMMEILNRLK